MIYALRKLIAFVFLGGIFWLVYYDPAEIGEPWFMHVLGVITAIFGVFWLVVPILVVRFRVRARLRQNRRRYEEWLARRGGKKPSPLRHVSPQLRLEKGESACFHEKGTLYVERGAGLDDVSVPGRPGDVAFPGCRRLGRKIQRTHFYLTDRRIIFAGKVLYLDARLDAVGKSSVEPGGIVFVFRHEGRAMRAAMTFGNPLVAEHIIFRDCAF